MPIRILPPEVVSRIAAGEVVERPASVVKELVENSLDAGATQITVEVRGGGVSLIRVLDNGSGIPAAEAELAFHRYATSKIRDHHDLEAIATLGFRGEALPSIALVSSLEFISRAEVEEVGTYLSLKGGQVLQKRRYARPPGTTVTVRNLFQDFPARLKFLKSHPTENGHIAAVVTRYALSHPEVRFTLYMDGRPALRTSGGGSLRDAASEVYGVEVAQGLLEVASLPGEVPGVSGLISPPALSRSSREGQSFFVNRRWVRNPVLSWALEEAYQGMLPSGKHPLAAVHLTLPSEEVDVNIHPAKAEVRFHHQGAVLHALQAAVSRALGITPRQPEEPVPSWMEGEGAASPVLPLTTPETTPVLRVLGQVASSYIVAEGADGIYLIDQHTAHERVLYEKVLAQQEKRAVEVQGLLEPLPLVVDRREAALLERYREALEGYGFALEPFGDGTYLVRAVPAVLRREGVADALKEVLVSLEEGGGEEWRRRIATSVACHGAVKAGQTLTPEEMRDLVRALEGCRQPRLCPHGRPVLVHLSSEQLEKQFGRR